MTDELTIEKLMSDAQMYGLCFLDMGHRAYSNTYRSKTYPRLVVVKSGAPTSPKLKQYCTTQYFVDDVECDDLQAVVAALNTAPHPMKAEEAKP